MIVGIATTMEMKITKVPWRVFDCSSKLLLSPSPSSDVEDFEHPDAVLWDVKFTDRDSFKPKTFENGISTVFQFNYFIHAKISACWLAKNT